MSSMFNQEPSANASVNPSAAPAGLDLNLAGKTALVTGGSRGIGRGCAVALARCGVDVAIGFARNETAANIVVTQCAELGVRSFAIQADVGEHDQVDAMCDSAVERLGGLDILVHAAGIGDLGPEPTQFDRTMRVMFYSLHYLARKVVPVMTAGGGGSMIVITSINAFTCGANAYCPAEAAKVNYCKGLARDAAEHNIRVNSISPGTIFTDMLASMPEHERRPFTEREIPLWRGREGLPMPEEIGKAAVFLASDLSSHITGVDLPAAGGQYIHL